MEHLPRKNHLLSGLPKLPPPPPPNSGKLYNFWNDDYDNDGSDNCDYNFGTFDDFGVKNDQKISHNMILMSKYKDQHGGKKGLQIRVGVFPFFL